MSEQEMNEEQAKEFQEKLKNMSPEELAEFQKKQCIFCKIVSREIPSKKVYEDNVCEAILDVAPASKGHLLIVPKEHYSIMPQVPDQVLAHIFVIAKRLSQIILKALKCTGTNIFAANGAVAGQRSQHFLLHLIPRLEGDHIIELNEKIIDKEMVDKVKTAVENRLFELMGLEKPAIEKNEVKEEPKDTGNKVNDGSEEPEIIEETEIIEDTIEENSNNGEYITSSTAKRYHIEECPFGKNITKDRRILVTKEDNLGKLPCSCTGLNVKEKKKKVVKRKKVIKKSPKKKTVKKKVVKKNEEDDVKLDDIAKLFK